MASAWGSTSEMAKKQVCMIVLMRAPRPSSWASLSASIVKKRSFLPMICLATSSGM